MIAHDRTRLIDKVALFNYNTTIPYYKDRGVFFYSFIIFLITEAR